MTKNEYGIDDFMLTSITVYARFFEARLNLLGSLWLKAAILSKMLANFIHLTKCCATSFYIT